MKKDTLTIALTLAALVGFAIHPAIAYVFDCDYIGPGHHYERAAADYDRKNPHDQGGLDYGKWERDQADKEDRMWNRIGFEAAQAFGDNDVQLNNAEAERGWDR